MKLYRPMKCPDLGTTDPHRTSRKWFNCILRSCFCLEDVWWCYAGSTVTWSSGECVQRRLYTERDSYSERDFQCPLYHHSNQRMLMTTETIGRVAHEGYREICQISHQIKATSKLKRWTGSQYFAEHIGRKQNKLNLNSALSICRCKD